MCLQEKRLSTEHVIPRSLGGILCCDFLCKPCNDQFGNSIEATAKSDPAVRIAIANLASDLPKLFDSIEDGQRYSVDTGPAILSGKLRNGEVRGAEGKLADGSIMKSEKNTPQALTKILSKKGKCQAVIRRSIEEYEGAPLNEWVQLSSGIGIKKWHDRPAQPDYSGRGLNPLVLLKVAYEFAVLLIGHTMLDDHSNLNRIRSALLEKDEVFADPLVERLLAPKYTPFHGICFHRNDPEAIIQVRLFGKLAFRVRLYGVALNVQSVVYTHDLKAGTDTILLPNTFKMHTE